ncbi:MAG: SRPBCC domain-containing protein, partial [bacterium]
MDAIFKALSDPSRRALLDALFLHDGQTLSALQDRLPMTRFGVMKHLAVLEDAGLVVSRKQGREKLHYLNSVPIRLVHDRWVSKFAAVWAGGLVELKQELERQMEKIFEIYIKTTPELLWRAITDPDWRAKTNFGAVIESDWSQGSDYTATGHGHTIFSGQNLDVDPPRRLVQSYDALWGEDARAEGTSRVTWEIEVVGDSCLLRVTHD